MDKRLCVCVCVCVCVYVCVLVCMFERERVPGPRPLHPCSLNDVRVCRYGVALVKSQR